MLRERGNRHLTCDLGNPDSERDWGLTGWSEPVGAGVNRHRSTGKSVVSIEYSGFFYTHFDYGYLVLRLAEPRTISGVTLTLAGRRIPVADELQESGTRTVWQIPFPPGMVKATSKFNLKIEATDWPVTDIAVVGDEIRDLHLQTVPGELA